LTIALADLSLADLSEGPLYASMLFLRHLSLFGFVGIPWPASPMSVDTL
jgi:hypothetical protein